jgi:tetratricopeptide (TPR) repeat protein
MRLGRAWLALCCAGYIVASIRYCPDWLLAKYPRLAALLGAGRLTAAEASDASPAYLLLHDMLSPATVHWLQVAAGTLAIVAMYVVATRWRGALAGALAATGLALSQSWLVYGATLEPDLLIAVLHVVGLLALLGGERVRRSGIAGGAIGLASALRPTSLVTAVVVLGWLLVERQRRRPWHTAAFAGAFVACAFMPAALLHLRAQQKLGATMSAGQVLHQGHRPEDNGLRAHYPVLIKLLEAHQATRPDHRPDFAHELYRRLAVGAGTKGEPERYWIDRTLALARAQPGAFVGHLARKWVMTLAAPSPGADVADVHGVVQELPAGPWLPTHVLALLGFGGLLLALRSREGRLLGGLVLGAQAVSLVFYHQQRYAVALIPVWSLLAAAGLALAWDGRRRWQRAAPRLATCVAPFALLLLPFVRFEHRLEARRLLVPARSPIPALREAGRPEAARAAFIEEQSSFPDSLWPWSPRGFGLGADAPNTALTAAERARARFGDDDPVDAFLLAVLYAQGERCDLALPLADRAAEAGFHGALEDSDVALDPDLLASDCLLTAGARDEALLRVRRSLGRWPGTVDGLARLAAATHGREGQALLFAIHDPASAHFALARARRRWGDPNGALEDSRRLAELVPDAAPLAAYERALALLDLGLAEDALDAYVRSLAVPYFVYGSSRFDDPIQRFLTTHPAHVAARELARRQAARQGWGG